jgi:type I pantothenate kinase
MKKTLVSLILCSSIFSIQSLQEPLTHEFIAIFDPLIKHIEETIALHSKRKLPIPIIAIAGASAVGKSYFTRLLAQLCERHSIKAFIFKYDDFLNPAGIPQEEWMHPQQHAYLDSKALHRTLDQINQGVTHITKPVFKKADEECNLENFDVILADGEFSLTGEEYINLFRYCTFGIYLDSNEKNIRAWKAEREHKKPISQQRSQEKFNHDLEIDLQNYRNFILPTKTRAQFIISKNSSHKYFLEENFITQ